MSSARAAPWRLPPRVEAWTTSSLTAYHYSRSSNERGQILRSCTQAAHGHVKAVLRTITVENPSCIFKTSGHG